MESMLFFKVEIGRKKEENLIVKVDLKVITTFKISTQKQHQKPDKLLIFPSSFNNISKTILSPINIYQQCITGRSSKSVNTPRSSNRGSGTARSRK